MDVDAELSTEHEPQAGDWVFEIAEEIPVRGHQAPMTVYDVNNGVGRVVGYGPLMAAIMERNDDNRPVWFHDKGDGSYRKWEI